MKKPDKKTAIRIYSGNITAIGGSEGAGIGGGNEQPGARTYIYGGDITAESSLLGAGIGGGDEEGTMGIWIYDGSIYAAGGSHGAGIGAGEGGGNMRKAEDGGGVNILGGHVTAKGGFYGAGIGGGNDENVSGTITIKGDDTVVYASAGPEGAGIGSGSCGEWSDNGDMKAKITIDCGKNSSINAYGFDKEILDEHPYDYFDYMYSQNINFNGAGIGAGEGGNMEGTVSIKGGNVNVWSGFGAAGIGSGMESGGFGGEGGDVYIGGGNIKIFTYPSINYINNSKNEAIGSGHNDSKSGSVYIHPDINGTGKYMRVICHHINDDMEVEWTKTAAEGERSKLCHRTANLEICECPHTDHEGNSGLTYTINGDGTHTVKCKFCGYKNTEAHTGDTCVCGCENPIYTVTLIAAAGNARAEVAQGNKFTLMYDERDIITANTNPPIYFQVKGWKLSGDETGTVYEPGSDVTVTSDMTFILVTEPVLKVETTEAQNGTIASDLEYAKPDDTVQFSVEPDFGYSVSSVSYKYLTGFDSNYN